MHFTQFEIYTDGERLFALPETDFPELVYVRKELNILQKLYSLYNAVMDTVEGWLDTLFVKTNVERIAEQLDDFVKKSRSVSLERCCVCVCVCVCARVCVYIFVCVGACVHLCLLLKKSLFSYNNFQSSPKSPEGVPCV